MWRVSIASGGSYICWRHCACMLSCRRAPSPLSRDQLSIVYSPDFISKFMLPHYQCMLFINYLVHAVSYLYCRPWLSCSISLPIFVHSAKRPRNTVAIMFACRGTHAHTCIVLRGVMLTSCWRCEWSRTTHYIGPIPRISELIATHLTRTEILSYEEEAMRKEVAVLVVVSVVLLTSASSKVIDFEAARGMSNGILRTRTDGKRTV